jgi:hypothetical protein
MAAKTPPAAPPAAPAGRPALVSLADAAKELGVGFRLLGVLEARGQLRIVRIGRRVMVPTSEIERLAREGAPLPPDHEG